MAEGSSQHTTVLRPATATTPTLPDPRQSAPAVPAPTEPRTRAPSTSTTTSPPRPTFKVRKNVIINPLAQEVKPPKLNIKVKRPFVPKIKIPLPKSIRDAIFPPKHHPKAKFYHINPPRPNYPPHSATFQPSIHDPNLNSPADSVYAGSSSILSKAPAQPKVDHFIPEDNIVGGDKVLYYLPAPDLSGLRPTEQQKRAAIDIIDEDIALIDHDIGLLENLIEIDLMEAFANAPALPISNVHKRENKAFVGDFTAEAEDVEEELEEEADYVIDMIGSASDNIEDFVEQVTSNKAINSKLPEEVIVELDSDNLDIESYADNDADNDFDEDLVTEKLAESIQKMNEIIEEAVEKSGGLTFIANHKENDNNEIIDDNDEIIDDNDEIIDDNDEIIDDNNENIDANNENIDDNNVNQENDDKSLDDNDDNQDYNDVYQSDNDENQAAESIVTMENMKSDLKTNEHTGNHLEITFEDTETKDYDNKDNDNDNGVDDELQSAEMEKLLEHQIDIIVDFLEPVIKNELSVHEV